MKKFVVFTLLMTFAIFAIGQDVELAKQIPFWKTSEFWMVVAGVGIIIIEWLLRIIPTTKPVYFIFKLVLKLLNKLVDVVPDKRK